MAKKETPLKSIGKTGLNVSDGFISDEYLPKLQGQGWIDAVLRMQDDGILSASLLAIDLLVRQVSWSVNGDDGTAVFIDEQLTGMSKSWDEVVSEILTFLPWGFCVQEIIYKRLDDGRVGWYDWSIRSQDTIQRWEFDKVGAVVSVEQIAPPDYDEVIIPSEKFLLFRTSAKQGNPKGRSVFRGAYTSWYYGTNLKRLEAKAIERGATGIAIARIPSEVIRERGAEYNSYVELVSDLRVDEQAGVVIPSDVDEDGNDLYELSLLPAPSRRAIDTDVPIARYDQQKAMAMLTDLLLLGHSNKGSYALSVSKQELFTNSLNAYLEMIASVVNKYAIPRLLALNGLEPVDIPKLVYTPIENVNLDSLGLFISRVSSGGFDWSQDEDVDQKLKQQAGVL